MYGEEMKYPCYIQFSKSGRVATLVHKNQKVMARLLVEGNFEKTCERIHHSHAHVTPAPFEAEVIELCEGESINPTTERIRIWQQDDVGKVEGK